MDVWSHDRAHHGEKIKKVAEQEGATQGYRRQFGKLWEISVFPLTLLIMDVPGIPRWSFSFPDFFFMLLVFAAIVSGAFSGINTGAVSLLLGVGLFLLRSAKVLILGF